MIRVLVFLFIMFSFSFSLEVNKPMFLKGEKIKSYSTNVTKDISNLLISHNGDFLVTLSNLYNNKIVFWSRKDRKKLFEINILNSNFIALSGNDKYLVYDDFSIVYLYDIEKRKSIQKIKLNENVTALDISYKGNYIATSSKNKIYLYNIKKDKLAYFFTIKKSVKKIKISHNNKFLILQSDDNSIKIYDLKTSNFIYEFNFKNDNIADFDISKNEKTIVVSSPKNIYLCDIKNKKSTKIEMKKDTKHVLFTNRSDEIILAGFDSMYLYSIKTKQFSQMTNFRIYSPISISDDNRYLVAFNFYDKVLIIRTLNQDIKFLPQLSEIEKYFYISSKNTLITQDNDRGIKIWNLKENKLEYILDKKEKINDISLSKNKKNLVFISTKTIKLWDLEKNKVIYSYMDKNESISVLSTVSISQNENFVAYINGDNYEKKHIVQLLDVNKSQVIQSFNINNMNYIRGIQFIDNRYILIYSLDKILLYDVIKNQKKYEINTNKSDNSIFQVYHKYYIVRSSNKEIDKYEVKDILTNKLFFSMKDKSKYILDIQDNYVFISDRYSSDKIKIWDLKNHKYINKKILSKSKNFYHLSKYNKELELKGLTNKVSKKIFYSNKNWVVLDNLKNKIYKYTNKNFLLNSKTFLPFILKMKPLTNTTLEVIIPQKTIKLINNYMSTFNIQIKNISNHKLYWIEPSVDNEEFTIDTNSIVKLEPNEIKNIEVSIQYNEAVEQSFSKDLTFKVAIGGEVVNKEKLNIEIEKREDIDIENIELGDVGLITVKINKFIDKNLTNLKVVLSEGNKSIENNPYYDYAYPPIETNESIIVHLPNDKTFFYTWGKGHDFTITVDADEIKPYIFKKHIKFDMPTGIYLLFFMLLFLLVVFIYYIYMGIFIPNIKKIRNNPSRIFDAKLDKLPYYKKILKRGIDKDYYENNFSYILENDLDKVSNFFKSINKEKANLFAQKANGKLSKIDNNFFEIILARNFELSLESFLLYFPNTIDINSTFNILEEKGSAKPIILIGQTEKEQKMLNESDLLHKLPYVLGLSLKNLKIFLLKQEHTKSLSQIFATRLDRRLISPYQEEGQLRNELYFFGREKIIHHIYSRELSNYFIVGARQIGKSSLLKTLELKFKSRDDVICFSFQDTRYLLKDIARALDIDKNSSLEEIEFYIADSSKTYLFLIDEADEFVKNEKNSGYKTLQAFRSLTQKGKAYFIMAGYYELFSQISFDYHSPIKNFGEIISLGKLESKACVDLVKNPMENLGLYYQNIEDGANIVIQTGQRANLIAMVCADIVKNLKPFTNEIRKSDIDKALECTKVRNTHYEWHNNIYKNQRQSYITQIIVYASVRMEYFTLKQVVDMFDSLELNVSIKEIMESLQLLELMYILDKSSNNIYRYTIPLMQKELQKDDEVMFIRVVREFKEIDS